MLRKTAVGVMFADEQEQILYDKYFKGVMGSKESISKEEFCQGNQSFTF
jgi:hypothetical protein